jgi:hypothetical protein
MITTSSELSSTTYHKTLAAFASKDDVWSTAFAKVVVFASNSSEACDTKELPEDVTAISSTEISTAVSKLPAGPYFAMITGTSYSVYKAYRLYQDFSFSFYYGVIDNQEGGYKTLSASHPLNDGCTTIAVPSRMYFAAPTTEKPLNGVRVSVSSLILSEPTLTFFSWVLRISMTSQD